MDIKAESITNSLRSVQTRLIDVTATHPLYTDSNYESRAAEVSVEVHLKICLYAMFKKKHNNNYTSC